MGGRPTPLATRSRDPAHLRRVGGRCDFCPRLCRGQDLGQRVALNGLTTDQQFGKLSEKAAAHLQESECLLLGAVDQLPNHAVDRL